MKRIKMIAVLLLVVFSLSLAEQADAGLWTDVKESFKSFFSKFKSYAEKSGEQIKKDSKKIGQDIRKDARKSKENIHQMSRKISKTVKEDAHRTTEQMKKAFKKVRGKLE